MQYLVLARKYRPQTFSEVVAQEHVTRTLSNAISSGRMAHAILFSGPRGTGKTTVARILAKALNCEANRETPSAVPCNTCRSCLDITAGNAVDVYEIDGASNNSVEQIRELRENIRYMPAHSPHKIYIIDEVHMLSTAAFNALLKTLEEPPPHVLFFFATTEPHKIPITILSRCQRHDFRRIDLNAIIDHMAYLCRQEEIEITTESLESIAKEADGSMRDALSLLDQVLTSSEHSIEHEQLLNILGVVDRQVMFSISEAILHKDINTLLDIIDHIHDRGHDIKKLYSDLIEHVRNLLVVKLTNGNEALLNIPSHEIPVMTAQVADVPEPSLSGLLNVLIKEESSVKFSSHPRIALEMVLIQLHQIRPVLSIDSLIEKLEGLKNAIDSGQPIAEETIPYPEGEPPSSPADQPLDSPSLAETQLKVSEKQPEPPPSSVNPAETEIPPLREQDIPPVELENASKEETSASESPEQFHHQMMDVLKKDHPSLAAGLANSRLQYVNDQHIGITVTGSPFTVNRIKSQKCMDILQNVCCNLLGKSVTIDIMVSYSAETEYKSKRKQNTRSSKKAISHPLVADTLEIFGGNVVDVKILQEH